MIQTIRDLLVQWNATYGERTKLQHAYLVLSVVGIVVAGLVGLLNYDSSRAILRVCFTGLGIFLVNGVVWALLYSLVINKLPSRRAPASRK
jgi:undecaprenyl pyrophosphate phosphatase UppP